MSDPLQIAPGIRLKSGQRLSLNWDDVEWLGGSMQEPSEIVTGERLNQAVTDVPERWIRARVRGWMEEIESPDSDYWIGTFIGRDWVFCSSHENAYTPLQHRIDYATRVCRHVNKSSGHGGVWLAGWIRGGGEFYLLYKDQDGDIRCPIECDRPFIELVGWTLYNWEQHCNGAISIMQEIDKNMALSEGQLKKLAQGESVSEKHLTEAPPLGI